MAHEIYYTSAPEGLKPGQAGFCTVGATEGLPPILLKRLESLSAYRHLTDGAFPGRMPVAHAHWIIQLGAGKDQHVLSRICDSGLDYTGRTNALAHHIALEPSELAPAGPAWMLAQSGAMLQQWNGQVGPILRHNPLPRGDVHPAPCLAWQRLAGDAGYAGLLAESFVKTRKPVCILFAPGQDVFPLIAEALAIIPPAQRWLVTFNTYFTSVPSNVACLWRCCLAGTPAAATTARYAATGIVLDLTSAQRLPPLTGGPWIDLARTGHGDPAALVAPQLQPPKARRIRSTKPAACEVADEELDPAPLDLEESPFVEIDYEPEPQTLDHAPPELAPSEGPPRRPDTAWAKERAQRRMRRIIAIYVIALATVAIGAWLQIWAYRSSADRMTPQAPRSLPAPPTPATLPATIPVVIPTVTLPIVKPTTPEQRPTVVVKPPDPQPVTPAVPVVRPPPRPVILPDPLERPAVGTGLRDVTTTIPVPPGDFDDLPAVTGFRLTLPSAAADFTVRREELAGSFSAINYDIAGSPRIALRFRSTLTVGEPVEVLDLKLDKAQSRFEATWRLGVLMRQPHLAAMAYWLLQNSTFTVADRASQRPQRIEFKGVEAKAALADAITPLKLPCDIVGPVTLRAARGLPPSWKQLSDPPPGPPTPGAATAWSGACVLMCEKPGGPVVPRFTARFTPASGNFESDLALQRDVFQTELVKQEAEARRLEREIQELQANAGPEIERCEKDLAAARRRSAMTPQELGKLDLTPELVKEQIETFTQSLTTARDALATALQPVARKKKECDDACRLHKAAVDAYDELDELELLIESPEGLRIALVRAAVRK